MRFGLAPLALFGLGLGSAAARADPTRYAVRGEAGVEYDTNPGRVEEVQGAATPPIFPSPAGRLVVSAEGATTVADRHTLSLSVGLAGKAFTRAGAHVEDVLVDEAAVGWSVLAARRTSVGLSGSYYDVVQRESLDARAFRSLTPALRLEQGVGGAGQLSAGAGYRFFSYKPDPSYDFVGPTVFVLYRAALPAAGAGQADWEWSGGLSFEARAFTGVRCVDAANCPGPASAGRRHNQFWVGHLEVTRTGDFLAGAGIAADDNASNSFGESVVRGLFHLRAVVLLPLELSLSARAELVLAKYRDVVPLARAVESGTPIATIEDETRSTMRVELVRPLGGHVEIGARYTFYTNEIAAGPVRFRRQIALLFLALAFER